MKLKKSFDIVKRSISFLSSSNQIQTRNT